MSGNSLRMSAAVSESPINLDQVQPPSAPREAWTNTLASTAHCPSSSQIPGNILPVQPVPRQRHFSNGSNHHSPPKMYQNQWQYQDNLPSQYSPWQLQPSCYNNSGTYCSPSTPILLPQQQTPYSASGYLPHQSGQVQRGFGHATGMPLGLEGIFKNFSGYFPGKAPSQVNILWILL